MYSGQTVFSQVMALLPLRRFHTFRYSDTNRSNTGSSRKNLNPREAGILDLVVF